MGIFGKIIGALTKNTEKLSFKLSALVSRGLGEDFY